MKYPDLRNTNYIHGQTLINDIRYPVHKRNVGDETVKHVFVNFGGKFPKNYIQYKDADLPMRLWPNAKFTIKCNSGDYATINYFTQLYGCDRILKFCDDDDIFKSEAYETAEVLYCMWIGNSKISNKVTKSELNFHTAMHLFKGEVFLLFNDIGLPSYRNFNNVIRDRIDNDDTYLDSQLLKNEIAMLLSSDERYSKFTIGIRNNIMHNDGKYWWNNRMKKINFDGQNIFKNRIEVLSDVLMYDMPDMDSLEYNKHNHQDTKTSYPRGIFIGTCFPERIDLFNKLFDDELINFEISLRGAGSEKINSPYASKEGRVESHRVGEIIKDYDYGIYIARGKWIEFAGQSIYDPIIFGKPVFIYEPIDMKHELMPGEDCCYFNTAEELRDKVNSINLEDLFNRQKKSLYERL